MFKKQALLPFFLSILVAAIVIFMARGFTDMYESFGASVLSFTQMIINYYWAILLLPLATIAGVFLTKYDTNNRRVVTITSLVVSIVSSQILLWYLYLPIYQLGS